MHEIRSHGVAADTCDGAVGRSAGPVVAEGRVLTDIRSGHCGFGGGDVCGGEVGCGGRDHGVLGEGER